MSQKHGGALPVEIVPQNPSGILVYSHVCGNVDLISFYHGPLTIVVPFASEQLAKFCKSGETPVSLIDVESMIRR